MAITIGSRMVEENVSVDSAERPNEADGPGKRYRVKCCNDIIQSMFRHHMCWCSCGKSAIDGGNAYTRCTGNADNFEEVADGEYNDY